MDVGSIGFSKGGYNLALKTYYLSESGINEIFSSAEADEYPGYPGEGE